MRGRFYNVDINDGYERLAKAIIVGGLRTWDYGFLESDRCLDLCLMVGWDRDELVRRLRVVEKKEAPHWWKLRRTCDDCGKPIADWNKSGYCRLCAPDHRGFRNYRYSKGLVCAGCGKKITNNARLCKTCESERRRNARLDGGGQADVVHEERAGGARGVPTVRSG